MAHDLADEGWTDSGIKAIYHQFAADEDSLEADWLTYYELDKPAMREEYFGNIYAKAEDNAGNVSDACLLYTSDACRTLYRLSGEQLDIYVRLTQPAYAADLHLVEPDTLPPS